MHLNVFRLVRNISTLPPFSMIQVAQIIMLNLKCTSKATKEDFAKAADRKVLFDFFSSTLLLPTLPEQDAPAFRGLSPFFQRELVKLMPKTYREEHQWETLKLSIVEFLSELERDHDLEVPCTDLFKAGLIASVDWRPQVAMLGDKLLRTLTASTDFENASFIQELFALCTGNRTEGVQHVTPAPVLVIIRAIPFLSRSIYAANSPSAFEFIRQTLLEPRSPFKLKQSVIQFVQWCFVQTKNVLLETIAKPILMSLLGLLDTADDIGACHPEQGQSKPPMLSAFEKKELSVFCFDAMASLAKRSPDAYDDVFFAVFTRLCSKLDEKDSSLVLTANRTLLSLIPIAIKYYKKCDRAEQERFFKTLAEGAISQTSTTAARLLSLTYIDTLFPFDDVRARTVDLVLCSCVDKSVKDEALKCLTPFVYNPATHSLTAVRSDEAVWPSFPSAVDAVVVKQLSIEPLDSCQGTSAKGINGDTIAPAIDFLWGCLVNERSKDPPRDAVERFSAFLRAQLFGGDYSVRFRALSLLPELLYTFPFLSLLDDNSVCTLLSEGPWLCREKAASFFSHRLFPDRQLLASLSELRKLFEGRFNASLDETTRNSFIVAFGYFLLLTEESDKNELYNLIVQTLVTPLINVTLNAAGERSATYGAIAEAISVAANNAWISKMLIEWRNERCEEAKNESKTVIAKLGYLMRSSKSELSTNCCVALGVLGNSTSALSVRKSIAAQLLASAWETSVDTQIASGISLVQTCLQARFTSAGSPYRPHGKLIDKMASEQAEGIGSTCTVADTPDDVAVITPVVEEIIDCCGSKSIERKQRCGAVQLSAIVRYAFSSSTVQRHLPTILGTFISLLVSESDIIQNYAAEGICLMYLNAGSAQRESLLSQCIHAGLVLKAKNTAFSELLSIAVALQHPPLFFFLLLMATTTDKSESQSQQQAREQSSLSCRSKETALLSLLSAEGVPKDERIAVTGFPVKAVTLLYRLSCAGSKGVSQKAKNVLHNVLTTDYKVCDEFHDEILSEVSLGIKSPNAKLRYDSSCCLPSLSAHCTAKTLLPLLSLSTTVASDGDEKFAKNGVESLKALETVILRLCDIRESERTEINSVIDTVLPFAIERGLSSPAEVVKAYFIILIGKLLKASAGNRTVREYIGRIIGTLLQELSVAESGIFNYISQHAAALDMPRESINEIRMKSAEQSPVWTILLECVRHVSSTNVDEVFQVIMRTAKMGVGLATKAGCFNLAQQILLVYDKPFPMLPKFISQCVGISAGAQALAVALKNSPDTSKRVAAKLERRYWAGLDESDESDATSEAMDIEDERSRSAAKNGYKRRLAFVNSVRSISDVSDALRKHYTVIVPLLHMAKCDTSTDIRVAASKAWEAASCSLRPYDRELLQDVNRAVRSSSWNARITAAKAVGAADVLLQTSPPFFDGALDAFAALLRGRVWKGKEEVFSALESACGSFTPEMVAAHSEKVRLVVDLTVAEFSRDADPCYRLAGLSCFVKLMTVAGVDCFDRVFPVLTELLRDARAPANASTSSPPRSATSEKERQEEVEESAQKSLARRRAACALCVAWNNKQSKDSACIAYAAAVIDAIPACLPADQVLLVQSIGDVVRHVGSWGAAASTELQERHTTPSEFCRELITKVALLLSKSKFDRVRATVAGTLREWADTPDVLPLLRDIGRDASSPVTREINDALVREKDDGVKTLLREVIGKVCRDD